MSQLQFDVFYDFAWPFVYNAAVWLDKVKGHYGIDLKLNSRNISLQQINAKDPVAIGLISQKELQEAIEKAERRIKREKKLKDKERANKI